MNELFRRFSKKTAEIVGNALTFVIAVAIIVLWAATGPLFNYSNTWQLIINTTTTIVTFLTVFLIQNTQNRDSKQINLKLDELIRATRGAKDALIDLETFTDDELNRLEEKFIRLSRKCNRPCRDPKKIEVDEAVPHSVTPVSHPTT
jgi:low affinity Fe/Cu permease